MRRVAKAVLVLLLCGNSFPGNSQESNSDPAPANIHGPAESLYLKLRSVGLDKTKTFKIREASLDRSKLHISLDDGTIAFTEAVDGHITGAFFVGYGEVLLIPPDQEERASVSLFTGGAILEETFSSAYFRFNDDVFAELQPFLRVADDPAGFVAQWDAAARKLAEGDALRLLYTFSDPPEVASAGTSDHMLHAYLEGNKLGGFDARYDSLIQEQVEVGQHKQISGADYYDVWASFSVPVITSQENPARREAEADQSSNAELTISRFKIQAHIRPTKELDAKATLNITAIQRTHRTLLFELSRMLRVSQVLADGHPVEFIHNQAIEGSHLARQGNDVLAVILPAPLQKGRQLQLSFEYSGSVLSEAANGLLYVGDRGTWYPNLGFAMSSFDLEFSYPVGWTLVATGHRVNNRVVGAEQTSAWRTLRPVPVAGFNLGKYSETTTHAGGVEVTTYATATVERGFPGTATTSAFASPPPPILPGGGARELHSLPVIPIAPAPPSPASNVETVNVASAHAIEFFERYFGPYPYNELSITQMPGRVSQGWPGLIFLSSYAFLKPDEESKVLSDPVQRLLSEQVVAHETAHQWWGDLVNWNGYRDQWIMEGLANYSALMLLESRDPVKFRKAMQAYRDELTGRNEKGTPLSDDGPVTLGFRLSSSQFPNGYDSICYGRGTWLFHMLRTMMRDAEPRSGNKLALEDEPFVRALHKLRKNYEDKAITNSQLMQVFESELPQGLWYDGHRSLDWFLESWIDGDAIPDFEVKDLKFSDKGKTTLVSGTLLQQKAPDTLVTAVPLYASIAGRNVFIRRVFAEGNETPFHVYAPAGTRKLVVDPEHTLLSRAK